MANKQIKLMFAAAILFAIVGIGLYQLSLAYPRNHFRAIQYDRCELIAGWKFRYDDFARTLCGLNAMDQLEEWAVGN